MVGGVGAAGASAGFSYTVKADVLPFDWDWLGKDETLAWDWLKDVKGFCESDIDKADAGNSGTCGPCE
jgi:hypothetical protein